MSQKIPETDYFSNAEQDSLEEITALHCAVMLELEREKK